MIRGVRDEGMLRGVPGTGLTGIYGRPFVPLEPLLDLGDLDAVHEEVCLALAQMPVDYTGGSHRAMGIMPPGTESEALVDYVRAGSVDVREAFRKAPDRDRLVAGLKREGVDTSLVERLA